MANYLLSAYTTAIRKEGKWTPGTYGGNDASVTNDSCGALRFKATCTDGTIGAKIFQQGWKISLYVDGVFNSTVTSPNSSTWADTALFSGLDTAEHTYLLLCSSTPNATPGGAYVSYVTVSSLNTAALAARASIAFYGDSIIQGTQGTGQDSSRCDAMKLATALGLACFNGGVGGTTVRNVSGSDNTSGESATRIAYLTSISPAPSVVFIRYGLNDSNQVKGPETAAEFGSSYTAMLTSITAVLTSAAIINESIIKCVSQATRTTWDAAIASAVTAVNTLRGNSNCKFVSILNWTEYTAQTTAPAQTTDGTHPNALGYSLLFNREIPLVSTSGVTINGPTTGTSGIASSAFTVALAGGATFTGDQTITLSDGGNGGTFTPSVGSPGTSSVVVTPTNGAMSFTFTYTPASVGAKTITPTNGQGWTNPIAIAYEATAPSDSGSVFRLGGRLGGIRFT